MQAFRLRGFNLMVTPSDNTNETKSLAVIWSGAITWREV